MKKINDNTANHEIIPGQVRLNGSRKMSKNPAKSRAIQQQLFKAMAKAILKRRNGNTTLDEIAAEVGRTKGTIYYHFKSKGEMLYHMTSYVYDIIGEAVTPIIRDKTLPPKERLEKAIYAHVLVACRNWEMVRAIQWTDVSLHELPPKLAASLRRRRNASEKKTAELIEEVARQTSYDYPGARVAMRMLFGIISGVFLWYRQGSGLSPEEMSRYTVDCIMDGIFSHSRDVDKV
ncbi:MAG: TetR/AcrR family transcriptional regulator [Dehalococcoidia bacterium]|nr:TetR/AcrR family transcriptional regulator [Dehalococcoidia bacterium]